MPFGEIGETRIPIIPSGSSPSLEALASSLQHVRWLYQSLKHGLHFRHCSREYLHHPASPDGSFPPFLGIEFTKYVRWVENIKAGQEDNSVVAKWASRLARLPPRPPIFAEQPDARGWQMDERQIGNADSSRSGDIG